MDLGSLCLLVILEPRYHPRFSHFSRLSSSSLLFSPLLPSFFSLPFPFLLPSSLSFLPCFLLSLPPSSLLLSAPLCSSFSFLALYLFIYFFLFLPSLRPSFMTALLRYSSHPYSSLVYTIQWFLVHSQSCATITTFGVRTFLSPKKETLDTFTVTPCFPSVPPNPPAPSPRQPLIGFPSL